MVLVHEAGFEVVVGFVVDDLPEKDKVYADLKFFENNFNGILPFEVTIDNLIFLFPVDK